MWRRAGAGGGRGGGHAHPAALGTFARSRSDVYAAAAGPGRAAKLGTLREPLWAAAGSSGGSATSCNSFRARFAALPARAERDAELGESGRTCYVSPNSMAA